MTAPTDQFVEIATRTQDAVTTAVRTWADTVQSVAGSFGSPALPDSTVAVERWFDLAQQVLDSQRALASTALSAGTRAAEAATEQAARAAKAAGAAVDTATGAVQVVGEKAAATVRSAGKA